MCVVSSFSKVKLIIFICLIYINPKVTIAQSVTNYEAKTSSFRFKNNYDTWKNWSKPINVDLNFKIDFNKKEIYIYNDNIEVFEIIGKENESPENDDIVLWCLNSSNQKFVFKIRPIKDDKLLFFIEHEKFQFVYKVNYLGE
jgi:hypothetical protein